MNRLPIDERQVTEAVNALHTRIEERLLQKGRGSFASRHEILGILVEEMHELTEATQHGNATDLLHELMDVAVGAVFAIACIKGGGTDW